MTNFTLLYHDNGRDYETQVYAKDWAEAEAHCLAIKRSGRIIGMNQTEVKLPAVGLFAVLAAWWKDRHRR